MIKILNPSEGKKVTKKTKKPAKIVQPPEEQKDYSTISDITILKNDSERLEAD
jgi:hypothetical protein